MAAALLLVSACAGPAQSTGPRDAPADAGAGAEAGAPARVPPGYREAAPEGERIDLPLAELFVPRGFEIPPDGRVPLFVHFQGGVPVAERNFVRFERPGVLIASRLEGRSGAFSEPYRDPAAFVGLLAAGERALAERAGRAVVFAPIRITFFSAGYGAVRELLKDESLFRRIDALVSADSIYADVVPGTRRPMPDQMKDFLRFARLAARGEKTFVLVHSDIETPYASTKETADALLEGLGIRRREAGKWTERGVPIASEAHAGRFHLFEIGEGDARAHLDSLYGIPEWVRLYVD